MTMNTPPNAGNCCGCVADGVTILGTGSNSDPFHTAGSSSVVPVTAGATPAAPAANTVDLWAQLLAGRGLLSEIDQNGLATPLQPFMGRNRVTLIQPSFGANAWQGLGVAISADGTITARVPASTNFCQSLQRLGMVSAAGAGSAAGIRVARLGWWLGNAAGLGGFFGVWRFNVSDAVLVGTANMFVGFRATVGTIIDVVPSTLTNIIGVGCDSGDTHLQLYAAGAAAQPRTDLGANFPVNTISTDVYELILFAPPNAVAVNYLVTRLNTGQTVAGTINAGAQLPSNTTFLAPTLWRSNGATAAATGIDIESVYIEAQN